MSPIAHTVKYVFVACLNAYRTWLKSTHSGKTLSVRAYHSFSYEHRSEFGPLQSKAQNVSVRVFCVSRILLPNIHIQKVTFLRIGVPILTPHDAVSSRPISECIMTVLLSPVSVVTSFCCRVTRSSPWPWLLLVAMIRVPGSGYVRSTVRENRLISRRHHLQYRYR